MPLLKASQSKKNGFSGVRYIFTAMGFLGFTVNYTLRVGINIAIIAMINGTAVSNQSNNAQDCVAPNSTSHFRNTTESHHKDGEFDWSYEVQSYVLGSFYVGYCISQIPGGRLSEIYSAKAVFGYGTLITSVLSLLTPLAARWNVYMLIILRVAEGLAQGVMIPSMYAMIGRWIPDTEKGLLATIIQSGISVGSVIAMLSSGFLCDSDIFGGWPSVFYIFGICGCIWFLSWELMVSNTPVTHSWITVKELKYITENQNIQHFKKLPNIPWLAIFTSVPFWALMITQFGQDWSFYTVLNDLPTYMDTILHFKIETNGIIMCVPYLAQSLVSYLVGWSAVYCQRKKYFSTQFIRKFCNTVSGVGTAVGILGVCLAGCNVDVTVAMFILGQAIGGFCTCGYLLSHFDLSPEYAGTLMGITNTLSNLAGFIAPVVVSSLTSTEQSLRQWRIVFYIVIAIVTSTSVIFVAFSTTDKQDWVPSGATQTLIDSEDEYSPDMRYGSLEKSTRLESK